MALVEMKQLLNIAPSWKGSFVLAWHNTCWALALPHCPLCADLVAADMPDNYKTDMGWAFVSDPAYTPTTTLRPCLSCADLSHPHQIVAASFWRRRWASPTLVGSSRSSGSLGSNHAVWPPWPGLAHKGVRRYVYSVCIVVQKVR
jgi:hypothetical protein